MANLSTRTLPGPALSPGNHMGSSHWGVSHICRPFLSEVCLGILASYMAGSVSGVYKVIFKCLIEKEYQSKRNTPWSFGEKRQRMPTFPDCLPPPHPPLMLGALSGRQQDVEAAGGICNQRRLFGFPTRPPLGGSQAGYFTSLRLSFLICKQ